MILIVTESARLCRHISRALNATDEPMPGVYAGANETIIYIERGLIAPVPIEQTLNSTPGTEALPLVPNEYKYGLRRQLDNGKPSVSEHDTAKDNELRALFATAYEVVFASDGGADAQARFHNICQHYSVGVPTARMWLADSDYKSIRRAYRHRDCGRHLHNLAQSGLVAMAMDSLFDYNVGQAFATCYGKGTFQMHRQDIIALDFLDRAAKNIAAFVKGPAAHTVSVTGKVCGHSVNLSPVDVWEDKDVADALHDAIVLGDTVSVKYADLEPEVERTADLFTLSTMQVAAYEALHFPFSKTVEIATSLFDKGLISSPLTSESRLPETMRRSIVRRYPDASHYPFCEMPDNRNHGIYTTERNPLFLTDDETALWQLIVERQQQAFSLPRRYAELIIGIEINGTEFLGSCEVPADFAIPDEATKLRITGKSTLKYSPKTPSPMKFTQLLTALDSYTRNTTPGLPFTLTVHDNGSVLDRLIADGFITVFFSEVRLTDKGRLLLLHFKESDIAVNLMASQSDAGALATDAHPKGKELMRHFERMLCDEVSRLLADPKMSCQVKTRHRCPRCKAEAMTANSKAIRCKHCGHSIPRFFCGLELPDKAIRQLITYGYTSPLYGFTGRKGRKFTEALVLDANFNVAFAPSGANIL